MKQSHDYQGSTKAVGHYFSRKTKPKGNQKDKGRKPGYFFGNKMAQKAIEIINTERRDHKIKESSLPIRFTEQGGK